MKILVLSDSHGTLRHMCAAIDCESPHVILHLGDHARDADRLHQQYPQIPISSVPGNCDFAPEGSACLLAAYGGVRVFMTHGHTLGVKSGLLRAELAARAAGAQVLTFGHTHQAFCEQKAGLWILNPGSCKDSVVFSYGIILVENGKILCYTENNLADLTEEHHAFND